MWNYWKGGNGSQLDIDVSLLLDRSRDEEELSKPRPLLDC